MQRCPYIHEMRERLLGPTQETVPLRTIVKERVIEEPQLQHQYHHPRQMAPPNNESNQVGTMIKVGSDEFVQSSAKSLSLFLLLFLIEIFI